jgi:hypothetical protein
VRQRTKPERQPDFYKYPPLPQPEIEEITSSAKLSPNPIEQKSDHQEQNHPHPMFLPSAMPREEPLLANFFLLLQARPLPTASAAQRSPMSNLVALEPDQPSNLNARMVSIELLDRLQQAKAIKAVRESAIRLQRLCAPHDVAQIPILQQPEPFFTAQSVAGIQNLSNLILSMQLLQDQPVVQQLASQPRDAPVQQPRLIFPSQDNDLATQAQSSTDNLNIQGQPFQGQSSASDLNFQQLLSTLALIENRRRELQHFLRGVPPR